MRTVGRVVRQAQGVAGLAQLIRRVEETSRDLHIHLSQETDDLSGKCMVEIG